MIAALRADLLKLRRRPASWVLLGAWLAMSVVFGYVIPALFVNSAVFEAAPAGAREAALASLLPSGFVGNVLSALPLFGAAILLIFGGLAMGSEYGWGTVSTTLVQRPTRAQVYLGRGLALAVWALLYAVLSLALAAVSALVVAAILGESSGWPSAGTIVAGVGAAWLMLGVAATLGLVAGTLLRGTALAVGLGLVYLLVVESLFAGFTPVSSVIAAIARWLPGVNASALAAGFAPAAQPENPFAAATQLVAPGRAAAVLGGYVVVLVAIGLLVFRRRDVAGI